jgi:hypothetical protein
MLLRRSISRAYFLFRFYVYGTRGRSRTNIKCIYSFERGINQTHDSHVHVYKALAKRGEGRNSVQANRNRFLKYNRISFNAY